VLFRSRHSKSYIPSRPHFTHPLLMATLRNLYPELECYNSGMLPVSDVHTVYWEESGNAAGKPVVFLHGGPGGGTIPKYRRFFDPSAYRIVLFDQRGCGKSTPTSCLEDNTTWALVSDMEKVRVLLGIEKWQVFGGSWGSTLALAYAQTHPTRVTELVLRGIFMLRKKEIDWFYQSGASFIFPDAWEPYVAAIPEEERGDFVAAYHKRLTSDDGAVRAAAAKAWSVWEGSTSKLLFDAEFISRFQDDAFADVFARIECHYFVNKGFFPTDDHLLAHMDAIRHIPTVIVQGRYDVVCPIITAFDMHKAFPEAEFIVTPDAGHSAFEPGNQHSLIEATDKFRYT